MSTAKDIVLGQLQPGRRLIEMFTDDMTDEEYFMPAVEGVNHTAWLLLHVASVWDKSVSALTNAERRLPESIHEHFRSGQPLPARSNYPSRVEIDTIFRDTLSSLVEALQGADDSTWDAPCPEGFLKDFFPTVGAVWGMQAVHLFWHVGQVATCRAAMRKKHVFA